MTMTSRKRSSYVLVRSEIAAKREESDGISPVEIHRQLVEVYGAKFQWELLEHPPYSPDLESCDFHIFGPLKKHLGSMRFNIDKAVEHIFISWFQGLDADFLYAFIDALVYRCNK
ncbi:hypothetical protein ANN_00664 [Periplaneta americana]|uniref:Histone-lysine N-methyltransferase SETMAR n=1 Tax=Periplaneta americana TaxID=6978 RepID=A0ABQ8TTU3_PERAM|nr:hypothetical protein ANN_00664 [Periplaneta americana]